ncbi:hypothetical protein PG995_013886 [Apiospora arundinis]
MHADPLEGERTWIPMLAPSIHVSWNCLGLAMYRNNNAHGWESPVPLPDSEDEYGGQFGIYHDPATSGDWLSIEAFSSSDSNMYIDPAMLNNAHCSSSEEYPDEGFEHVQYHSETDSPF